MIRTVIFFVGSPVEQAHFDELGIEFLSTIFHKVELWDISPLVISHYQRSFIRDQILSDKYRIFLNKDELHSSLSTLGSDSFIITPVPYHSKTFFFYHFLYKSKIPFAIFTSKRNIDVSLKSSFVSRIQRVTLKGIIRRAFTFLPLFYLAFVRKVPKARFILPVGGLRAIEELKYGWQKYVVDSTSQIIWTHSHDYETYLKINKNLLEEHQKKYFVFLDVFNPFAPEYLALHLDPVVSANEYYQKLRHFFDLIEHEYNVKVIIAAHPRSDYEHHPDYFGGRKVIRRRTAELVKEAEGVICEGSTSVGFGVLYKKPILFITMKYSNNAKAYQTLTIRSSLM